MNKTLLVVAQADGELCPAYTFANSWGSAAFIWEMLWRTYLHPAPRALPPTVDRSAAEAVWALDRDTRLAPAERITLITTFDRCLIHRHDCRAVANAFDTFVWQYERRRGNRACSLSLQSGALRELASHPEVLEVGWQQTSVAADLWVVDTSDDDTRPYNVKVDTGHWFLFDRYPELKTHRWAHV